MFVMNLQVNYFVYLDETAFTQIIEKALGLSEMYNTLLESDKIEWSDKSQTQERYYCGMYY